TRLQPMSSASKGRRAPSDAVQANACGSGSTPMARNLGLGDPTLIRIHHTLRRSTVKNMRISGGEIANLPKTKEPRRPGTQKWPNRLKPFLSEKWNVTRFDASDYAGVAGYGGQQPTSVFFDFSQLLKCPELTRGRSH